MRDFLNDVIEKRVTDPELRKIALDLAEELMRCGLIRWNDQFVVSESVVRRVRFSPVEYSEHPKPQQRGQKTGARSQGRAALVKPLIARDGFCNDCGSFDRCYANECGWRLAGEL